MPPAQANAALAANRVRQPFGPLLGDQSIPPAPDVDPDAIEFQRLEHDVHVAIAIHRFQAVDAAVQQRAVGDRNCSPPVPGWSLQPRRNRITHRRVIGIDLRFPELAPRQSQPGATHPFAGEPPRYVLRKLRLLQESEATIQPYTSGSCSPGFRSRLPAIQVRRQQDGPLRKKIS